MTVLLEGLQAKAEFELTGPITGRCTSPEGFWDEYSRAAIRETCSTCALR